MLISDHFHDVVTKVMKCGTRCITITPKPKRIEVGFGPFELGKGE